MPSKNRVTVSVRPTTPRPTSTERRAAQIAMLSDKQAQLKREAAERRRQRGPDESAPVGVTPRGTAARRRSGIR